MPSFVFRARARPSAFLLVSQNTASASAAKSQGSVHASMCLHFAPRLCANRGHFFNSPRIETPMRQQSNSLARRRWTRLCDSKEHSCAPLLYGDGGHAVAPTRLCTPMRTLASMLPGDLAIHCRRTQLFFVGTQACPLSAHKTVPVAQERPPLAHKSVPCWRIIIASVDSQCVPCWRTSVFTVVAAQECSKRKTILGGPSRRHTFVVGFVPRRLSMVGKQRPGHLALSGYR